jgi:NAD(P)-dependent dehydrogenase (short-subunit alcohol dehydrogenase family)
VRRRSCRPCDRSSARSTCCQQRRRAAGDGESAARLISPTPTSSSSRPELRAIGLTAAGAAGHGRTPIRPHRDRRLESWRVGIAFGLTNYATAKAAALGFMRQLAHEVGRKGVTVNAVSLGTMNNFGYEEQAKATAVGRAGTPEDVGALVAYLVSGEAGWMTGQTLPLNGGAVTA